MTIPRSPQSLAKPGRGLWRDVCGSYELSPAELETLRQACRVTDLIARIDAELIDLDDLTTEGSAGQLRSHPLLQSSADQRRVLDSLLRSLALPMPGEEEGRRRSPAAVAAAQQRWRQERGRGSVA